MRIWKIWLCTATLFGLFAAPVGAQAQSFPNRSITLVIPFAPGGSTSIVGRVMRIERAHVEGLTIGALGRAGLNAIGRKLLEVADVDEIIIQGGTRTTGRAQGKVPRPIRFPCQAHSNVSRR